MRCGLAATKTSQSRQGVEEEELGGVTTIALFLATGVAWRLLFSRALAALLASVSAT